MIVKMAISRMDLRGTYKETMEHHDPIEVMIMSFEQDTRVLHILTFDLMHCCFDRCDDIRSRLGQSLGISRDHIILHFTHTHTGPRDEDMQLDKLLPMLTQAMRENLTKVEEVSMAYQEIDSEGRWNINRRTLLPHDMGKMTIWAGCEETADGRLTGDRIIQRRLKDWFGEDFAHPDLDGPFYYDEDERDTLLQQLIFKNTAGELVGSLVRFACHPPIAGHTTNRRYSADFPGYVRRILKEKWGGEHVYMTGPCGNIAPWEVGDWKEIPRSEHVANSPPLGPFKEEDAAFEEAERIASEIVQSLSDAYSEKTVFEPLASMDSDVQSFDLKIRDDFQTDSNLAQKEMEDIWSRLERNDDLTLGAYKQLVDRYTFLGYYKYFTARGYVDSEILKNGFIAINIPAMRLNNLILQGTPGESFWETPQLAQASVKARGSDFISFSFANGSITYLPTDDERPFGDYETCYCIAGEGAVTELSQQLERDSLRLLERL